ncbi:MAG: deoxyribodipyrimidine photo-lyase [Woeseiaceae bacterium]|nr:deoxyribodipyrimidine photo-lyase [Woeseiaceae bacterium]
MSPIIVWLRRNLRLRDNPAFERAAASGRPVIPVYVAGDPDTGGASRWWLHHSLVALDESLSALGGRLLVIEGDPAVELARIAAGTGARELCYVRRYEPAARAEEAAVERALDEQVSLRAFDDALLHHPDTVLAASGAPYRVFTPYWRRATALGGPAAPATGLPRVDFAAHGLESVPIAALGLTPAAPDWAGGLRKTWAPGEASALARLDALGTVAEHYREDRDRPDRDATTRLSPHLAFGEVSVRQVWAAVAAARRDGMPGASAEAVLRQLYWRDFSHYLLHHFPALPERPLRPEFEHFPWIDDPELLATWQRGRTGYPIVDAGMRELWHTGWMHNRVRMIVASFLVKDLMIPWQRGAEWFLDTLVDANLANNSASWQWVAGCGTDAAPYFRIFNPARQAEKFDPEGRYVRRWVPEAGTARYPAPVVDHAQARRRALEAYEIMRGTARAGRSPD